MDATAEQTPTPPPLPTARRRKEPAPTETPAPVTATPKPRAPKANKEVKLIAFFQADEIRRAVLAALDSEADTLFRERNEVLKLRGEGADRLRQLCRLDAEPRLVAEVRLQLDAVGGPDIDPVVALTNPRAAFAWALACYLMRSDRHEAFLAAFK